MFHFKTERCWLIVYTNKYTTVLYSGFAAPSGFSSERNGPICLKTAESWSNRTDTKSGVCSRHGECEADLPRPISIDRLVSEWLFGGTNVTVNSEMGMQTQRWGESEMGENAFK